MACVWTFSLSNTRLRLSTTLEKLPERLTLLGRVLSDRLQCMTERKKRHRVVRLMPRCLGGN